MPADTTGDDIGAPLLCPHHSEVIRNAEDIDRLDHEVTHAQAVEMARQCCQWRLRWLGGQA
jgi:hypothetical protein